MSDIIINFIKICVSNRKLILECYWYYHHLIFIPIFLNVSTNCNNFSKKSRKNYHIGKQISNFGKHASFSQSKLRCNEACLVMCLEKTKHASFFKACCLILSHRGSSLRVRVNLLIELN